MTRGRPPKKGLADAATVAMGWGTVMRFMRSSDNLCDFMIKGNDKLVFASVRKAIRLSGTRVEMEREFQEAIVWLRSFPVSVNIIRELWTYSRRGMWRFFRIEQTGIVEICQDGAVMKNSFIEVIRTIRGVPARKKGSALVMGNG